MVSPPHEEAGRGLVETARPGIGPRVGLAALIAFFTIACCLSLAVGRGLSVLHAGTTATALATRSRAAAAFYFVSLPFVFTRFSFGYFVGFNFFTMVLGFLWLSSFSKLHYDHGLAAISAAASAVLFLLPALLINAPVRQVLALTAQNFERLVNAILLLSLATILGASFYNFRLISLADIYDFRNELYFPGACPLPDRNRLQRVVAVCLCLLSGAGSSLESGVHIAAHVALLSDYAEQARLLRTGLVRGGAGSVEILRGPGYDDIVDPFADAVWAGGGRHVPAPISSAK